jgi:uncharacterized protein GlcG (DUF336 family)
MDTHSPASCAKEKQMRTKTVLTIGDARKMVEAAKVEAEKNKWPVTIAVVDEAGLLLMLERMDGARAQTAEVATLKARSAAITHRPGKTWEDTVKQRPGVLNFPDAFHVQGGVPIVYQGDVIGAVGVSGVQSFEDEQVASAGIAALGL